MKGAGVLDQVKYLQPYVLSGTGRKISGASSTIYGIFLSVDGIFWLDNDSNPYGGSSFSIANQQFNNLQMSTTELFIAFAGYGGAADMIGELKDLMGHARIAIPAGHTLKRIV